jgi:hypothetical protein
MKALRALRILLSVRKTSNYTSVKCHMRICIPGRCCPDTRISCVLTVANDRNKLREDLKNRYAKNFVGYCWTFFWFFVVFGFKGLEPACKQSNMLSLQNIWNLFWDNQYIWKILLPSWATLRVVFGLFNDSPLNATWIVEFNCAICNWVSDVVATQSGTDIYE